MLQFINFLAVTLFVVLAIREFSKHKTNKPIKIKECGRFKLGHPVIVTKGPYFGKTGKVYMIVDKDPEHLKYLANEAIDIYVIFDSGGIRVVDMNYLELN